MVSGAILQFPVCKCGSQILHLFTSYAATKTASIGKSITEPNTSLSDSIDVRRNIYRSMHLKHF